MNYAKGRFSAIYSFGLEAIYTFAITTQIGISVTHLLISDLDGLKAQKRLAQGNALGIGFLRLCALKGQKRMKSSNAFALSGRIPATSLPQGVALG